MTVMLVVKRLTPVIRTHASKVCSVSPLVMVVLAVVPVLQDTEEMDSGVSDSHHVLTDPALKVYSVMIQMMDTGVDHAQRVTQVMEHVVDVDS